MRKTIAVCLVVWLAGCGSQAPRAEEPPPTSDAPPEGESTENEETSSTSMQHHFADVAAARDAVVRGDLPAAHGPLARIAEHAPASDMPTDWADWVEGMQNTAREASEARTLPQAARAVAALGGSCGDCHGDTGGGPTVSDAEPPPSGEGLDAAMRRHAWGVEQLWLGLTAPSFQAWTRGAEAIRTAHASSEDAETNEDLVALQELAASAGQAAQQPERVRLYGELLQRCAGCHSETR